VAGSWTANSVDRVSLLRSSKTAGGDGRLIVQFLESETVDRRRQVDDRTVCEAKPTGHDVRVNVSDLRD
jgi:hypothetical protein